MLSTKSMSLKERKILMFGMAQACKDSVGRGAMSDTERKEVIRRMDILASLFDKGTLSLWRKVTMQMDSDLRAMWSVQEGLGLW